MNRNTILVLALVAFITGASYFVLSQKRDTNVTTFSTDSEQGASTSSPNTATDSANQASGLKIEDVTVGTGEEAKSNSLVTVHYKGTLENGTQFDSSYERNQPFTTPLGQGSVIKGWDLGIPGMKVGGTRRLTIPADLAYGSQGQGSIPPNSTLIFVVELLEVKNN
jgi:FKBP-type peptidyl-prolyl cis-trans isomerase